MSEPQSWQQFGQTRITAGVARKPKCDERVAATLAITDYTRIKSTTRKHRNRSS
jgi:hypothetical protein